MSTRTRTLRLLAAGTIALVGVVGTATQASAGSLPPIERSTLEVSPLTAAPDDPQPGCDPEVMLCADPAADPGPNEPMPEPEPECPEIPSVGGSSVPDPGCRPECPEVTSEVLEVVPADCPTPPECPEDQLGREPLQEPWQEVDPRLTEPCDPPVVECAVVEREIDEDDVIHLRRLDEPERHPVAEDCPDPGRPNFTG